MKKVRVCNINDIRDGEARGFEIDDTPILIVKQNGKVYAFEDVCSHQHMPISENYDLEEGKLICMWHGAEFELETGKNLSLPAPAPIKKFDVEIDENGNIMIIIE